MGWFMHCVEVFQPAWLAPRPISSSMLLPWPLRLLRGAPSQSACAYWLRKMVFGTPAFAAFLCDRAVLSVQPTREKARNPANYVARQFRENHDWMLTTGEPQELRFDPECTFETDPVEQRPVGRVNLDYGD